MDDEEASARAQGMPSETDRENRGNVAPRAPRAASAEGAYGMAAGQTDEADGDLNDVQPAAVVDTTAELLGRAKPRGTRTRTAAAPKARKTAVKKPAPARRGRAKKSDDA